MRARMFTVVLAIVALGLAAGAGSAQAQDPGRWIETGHDLLPLEYFQGLTSDPHHDIYFDGLAVGLYRTDRDLTEEARNVSAIPTDVYERERYNHIGDPTWDNHEHGRVLLPLECYIPFLGNPCKTGAIGVADPVTLQWRYYVKLDPAFIDKAMWAEASPDGKLLWTSNGALNGGNDLLAYSMKEIKSANAAPAGPLLKPVRVLPGAVPPSGITGATFYKGRLFLAGQGGGPFQVWSVDLKDGSRRLEIEKSIVGESEGLDIIKTRGGTLHWLITPLLGTGGTYGNTSALVHFNPLKQPKVRCGDVITKSVKLDADVVCPDGTPAAVTIAADHVTLDLDGHSIVNGHTDAGDTAAITTAGPVTDLEVSDGTVRSGDQAIKAEASHSEFEHLTVDGRGTITGDDNEVERSSFTNCGSAGMSVNGDDAEVERNTFVGCPLIVTGMGAEIERNDATQSVASGIKLVEPGAWVARNTANDNAEWGIESVLGTFDGSGNHATGNGQPAQCLNVTCG